ncbi:hypothetical protein GCM10011594_30980 [Nakamurella endophytica]|uniref:Uncharacterized protein n=1 Tax=Nakamurella endophytica TaxID=1748367 RepID=A0A917T4B6_9ACTN|nr:hypothetical protein GCM10011594_30980 [Nakamurella endophytica]
MAARPDGVSPITRRAARCAPAVTGAVTVGSPRPGALTVTVRVSRAAAGACTRPASGTPCRRTGADTYALGCTSRCFSVWVYAGGRQVEVTGDTGVPGRPWTDRDGLERTARAVLAAFG